MERLCNIFGHPHKLIVRRGWGRALRHKEANGLCGIAKIGREHYRGAPDEVFRGERISSGKPHHDIGEQEGEATQVLSGWSGSLEGTELAL